MENVLKLLVAFLEFRVAALQDGDLAVALSQNVFQQRPIVNYLSQRARRIRSPSSRRITYDLPRFSAASSPPLFASSASGGLGASLAAALDMRERGWTSPLDPNAAESRHGREAAGLSAGMGDRGFEPRTSALSERRSNQLS